MKDFHVMNNVFVAGSDDRLILNGVVFAFQRRGQLADSSGMVSSASLILVQYHTSKIMSTLERLEGKSDHTWWVEHQ